MERWNGPFLSYVLYHSLDHLVVLVKDLGPLQVLQGLLNPAKTLICPRPDKHSLHIVLHIFQNLSCKPYCLLVLLQFQVCYRTASKAVQEEHEALIIPEVAKSSHIEHERALLAIREHLKILFRSKLLQDLAVVGFRLLKIYWHLIQCLFKSDRLMIKTQCMPNK